jgi:hypothetical protein
MGLHENNSVKDGQVNGIEDITRDTIKTNSKQFFFLFKGRVS